MWGLVLFILGVFAAMFYLERVFELLDDRRITPKGTSVDSPAAVSRGKIEFKDVSFSYDGDKGAKVLKSISFTIAHRFLCSSMGDTIIYLTKG